MYTFLFYIYLYFAAYCITTIKSRTPKLFIENFPTISEQLCHTYYFKILTKDVQSLYDFLNDIPLKIEEIKLKQQDKYTTCFIETPDNATHDICELALEHTDLKNVKFLLNEELIE